MVHFLSRRYHEVLEKTQRGDIDIDAPGNHKV